MIVIKASLKNRQINYAYSSVVTEAFVGGVTHEFGIVTTDKGWSQYYETIYYSHGIGLSWSGNFIKIMSRNGKHPTLSDWKGGVAGMTFGHKAVGITPGGSTAYFTLGGSLCIGLSFDKKNRLL